MNNLINSLSGFLIYYPILVTLIWISGTLLYYFLIERRKKEPNFDEINDGISFLVPCYNEEDTIEETIKNLSELNYPLKEIIVINDGSSDGSSKKLRELKKYYNFKFIDLKVNHGKANALNTALDQTQFDYIICVDADTLIDDKAPYYMIDNFKKNKNVGAVTGNPRIRNKDSLLAKIQVIEYASIIGCIKRAQSLNGFINTVSGVFVMFRKSALLEVGAWDTDMITEDIAISWKLHFKDYHVLYEPRALCWMLAPETLTGLWKQRVRWAQGGQEVIKRDFTKIWKKKNFSFWLLGLENIVSQIWATLIVLSLVAAVFNLNWLNFYFYFFNFNIIVFSMFILIFFNIIFFTLAALIDSRYERHNLFYLVFLSWYPLVYWLLNAFVSVAALPKSMKSSKGEFATWTSPDRGNIQKSDQI